MALYITKYTVQFGDKLTNSPKITFYRLSNVNAFNGNEQRASGPTVYSVTGL